MEFYVGNKTCKSCLCKRSADRAYGGDNNYFTYRQRLCNTAKYRAIDHKVAFSLKPDDIIIPSKCPVFNIPLIIGPGKTTDNSPTIDRLDHLGPYTKENIQVISWRTNVIKSNASPTELRILADWIESQLEISKKKFRAKAIYTEINF